METRVIVADSRRARIFSSHSVMNKLIEEEGFVNNEARLANRELVSDAPGRSANRIDSFSPAISAKEHDVRSFAKDLARHLKAMHSEQHFDQLVLIASPKFLGLLRRELHAPLDRLVSRTIDKDLTTADVADIIDEIKS